MGLPILEKCGRIERMRGKPLGERGRIALPSDKFERVNG